MLAPTTLGRLRVAFVFIAAVATSSTGWAQSAEPVLDTVVTPGMTVWVTGADSREEKVRVTNVTADTLTTTQDGNGIRTFRTNDVMRVRARQSDSVLDGALIGAGVAVAGGLFLCTRTEPWENCRDDVGPITRIAAIGAGVGIAIDALIRGRKTIYEAHGSARLRVSPLINPRIRGLNLTVFF